MQGICSLTSVARYVAWSRRSLYWRLAKAQLLRISHPRFRTCSPPQNAPRESGGGILKSGAKVENTFRCQSCAEGLARECAARADLMYLEGLRCFLPTKSVGFDVHLGPRQEPAASQIGLVRPVHQLWPCRSVGHSSRAAAEFTPGRP